MIVFRHMYVHGGREEGREGGMGGREGGREGRIKKRWILQVADKLYIILHNYYEACPLGWLALTI